MAEVTASEVIPKVIVRESLPVGPGTSAREKVAKKVLEKQDETNWREGIESARKKPVIEANKVNKKAEEIGTERDSVTGAKKRTTGSDEEKRFTEFKKEAGKVTSLLEQGYDKIPPADQDALRDLMQGEVLLRPELAKDFSRMTAVQKKAFLERVLRDSKYADILRERTDAILDPKEKLVDITNEQDLAEEARLDHEDAKAARESLNGKLDLNAKKLEAFAVKKIPGSPDQEGTKLLEMKRAEQSIQAAQTELTSARERLAIQQTTTKGKQDELTVLQRQAQSNLAISGPRTIPIVQQELNQAMNQERVTSEDVAKSEQKLSALEHSRTALQREQEALIENQKTLDMEKRQHDRKVDETDRKMQRKKWTLEDAKKLRQTQEQDLVDAMRGVFAESVNRYFEKQQQEVLIICDAEIVNYEAQAKDEGEKAILDATRMRWLGNERYRMKGIIGRRTREAYRPIDKNQVDEDFENTIDDGPEPLLKKLLQSRVNAAGNRIYTDVQIDAMLADKSDNSLYKKTEPVVLKQLLARKLATGGVNPEDMYTLSGTSWGQNLIKESIEKNSGVRSEIEKATGEKAVIEPGFFEKFGQQMKKRPWLLYTLLGIPFAAIIAANAGAKDLNLGR